MARVKDRARQAIKAGDAAKSAPFRTATYARLSVASFVAELDSIASQQMLMRAYIKGRDEFLLVKEYKDDGISGTRFDRQEFGSLLSEVRKGNINCILVKDFSRFGRDHIEVGNYLEKIFPFLGVRFISINDGYDSFDKDSADKKLAVILKNLVNEYIAKDTSVKVASGYEVKQEKGEYDGGCAPYGYVFADERKSKLAVDEEPAEIVKDIFSWTMQGDSAAAIVKRLTEKNINPPKAYRETGDFYRRGKERRYWNEFTVNAILRNMVYAGHMPLHKWKGSKADGLGPYRLAESEWRITKDTHKAIVTEGDFGLVREILKIRKKRYETLHAPDGAVIRPENLLKGKVFCGDCLVPAARTGSNHRKKTGKIRIYRYRCRTYKEKGTQECTSKSISEKDLEDIVCQAVMESVRQEECTEDLALCFHREFFRKMQKDIEKEKNRAERAICREKKDKMLLYGEYSSKKRNDRLHNRGDCVCGDGISGSSKEWYLKEKQKREEEIRFHEERKMQLEEKKAFLEQLEKEQAERIKELFARNKAIAGKEGEKGTAEKEWEKGTAQMASVFVDKIFLYNGKMVEVVLNFQRPGKGGRGNRNE